MHKTCIDLKDCTIYTTLFPCNECTKVIIQAGIKEIYYLTGEQDDKIYNRASKELLKMARYSPYYNEESLASNKMQRKRSKSQPETPNKRQRLKE